MISQYSQIKNLLFKSNMVDNNDLDTHTKAIIDGLYTPSELYQMIEYDDNYSYIDTY